MVVGRILPSIFMLGIVMPSMWRQNLCSAIRSLAYLYARHSQAKHIYMLAFNSLNISMLGISMPSKRRTNSYIISYTIQFDLIIYSVDNTYWNNWRYSNIHLWPMFEGTWNNWFFKKFYAFLSFFNFLVNLQ